MCIRDRVQAAQSTSSSFSALYTRDTGKPITLKSVSYTHLDVYKRQVFIEQRYKLDKTLLSGPELAALVAGAAGVGSVSPAPLARSLAEKLGGSGADDLPPRNRPTCALSTPRI